MTMTPNSWAGVCLVFVLLQACTGSGVFQFIRMCIWCTVHRNRPAASDCIHALLSGTWLVLHLSEALCVFLLVALQRASCCFSYIKRFTSPLLCSCHWTCCDGRLWQLFIRVICSHLAHDGLPWSADLPSFSLTSCQTEWKSCLAGLRG